MKRLLFDYHYDLQFAEIADQRVPYANAELYGNIRARERDGKSCH